MDKPIRYKEFNGYIIFEDGTIYGKNNNQMSVREHDGRYEVQLQTPKGRKIFTLSRLLYWLFTEEFDYNNKDLCVSYKDGNKLNIKLDNLELVERKNLIQGEKHKGRIIITDEQAEKIRAEWHGKVGTNQHDKTGKSLNDLAKEYNCTKGNIKMIVQGRSRNKDNYKLK